jgi:HEAT repeat protein
MAVRTRAAELLAERKSVASLPALVAAVKQNGENAAVLTALDESIYAITLSQPIGGITAQASGKDDLLRRAAYRALGALAAAGKANAGVIDRLKAGLTDGSPGIRGASARALAATRTPEAFEAILALQDDPKPAVVGDLALALGSFSDAAIVEKAKEILVEFLQSGEPEIAAGALDSIGLLGFTKLLPAALDKVSHPDGRVRAAAIRAASLLADNASTRSVLNAIIGRLRDEELSNQVLAATLLGKFSNDNAVLGLSQAVNEPIPELRFATIAALGATRHPGAANVLLALFDDNDREIRVAAATAMGKLAMITTVPDLEAAAERATDPATAEALRKAIEIVKQTGR